MPTKLSDIVRVKIQQRRVRDLSEICTNSLIDFTDLTPLTDKEIDLFWPYPGSELERKIALRLATRTAEEALKAIMAKWSGTNAPCHKCGLAKHGGCNCLTTCTKCWVRHYKDNPHTCDPMAVEVISPFDGLLGSIGKV